MLWKIITIVLLVFLLIFGYKMLNNRGLIPSNTQDATNSAQQFSTNFLSSFNELSSGTALLQSDSDGTVPIVYEKDLGEISPLRGKVLIQKEQWGPGSTELADEYVTLSAAEENITPININGWSLQSMVSGVRVYIPDAVEDLVMHNINKTYEVELAPKEVAIVRTAHSPLGISFKTNMCTGYVGQFQNFEPTLEQLCPSPKSTLPATIQNIQTYGKSCFDLLQDLRPCTYLTDDILEDFGSTVSSACTEFLRKELTYSYCHARNKSSEDFYTNSQWRIFLGENNTLWNEEYEVIRLLDELGRTVDVYAY